MQQPTHAPVRYRIVVRGRLGERLSALFDDLDHQPGSGASVLEGSLDQAGLRGLLDRLSDLGIDLISVNPVDSAGADTNALENS